MLELETATEILDGYKPQTANEYRGAFLHHLQKNGRKEQPQPDTLKAGIDCGRWVVNCICGGGIALHPQWQIAGCFTCGRWWNKIEFPSPTLMLELERIFRLRPAGAISKNNKRYWSWWPEETLDDLKAEHRRYGWPTPKGGR